MNEPVDNTIDDYELLCVIGKGVFGKIYLVKEIKTAEVYAMKVVKKILIEQQNKLKYIFTERNLLIEFNHPFTAALGSGLLLPKLHCFIIKIVTAFQNQTKFYFILQYCPGGELYNLLAIKQKFSEQETKFYAAQIVLALEYMHQKDIVYRDLKPQNIMIDRKGYIKLTDFGLSKKIKRGHENVFSISGMPQYTAPEVLFQKQCNKAVDFWCLGSLLHQMLTGFPPFFSQNLNQLYESIKFQEFVVDEQFQLSKECVSLLQGLFRKDPDLRLGMKGINQMMMHPWFSGINWQAVVSRKYKPPFVPILKSKQDTTYFSAAITSSSLESVNSYSAMSNRESEASSSQYFSGFDYDAEEEEVVQ